MTAGRYVDRTHEPDNLFRAHLDRWETAETAPEAWVPPEEWPIVHEAQGVRIGGDTLLSTVPMTLRQLAVVRRDGNPT